MSFRRAAKKDTNQTEIVDQLRQFGFDVDIVHQLKKLYDIVVSGYNRYYDCTCAVRVEIKMPGEKLSEDEAEYWKKQAHTGNLIIAERVEDVLTWFGW